MRDDLMELVYSMFHKQAEDFHRRIVNLNTVVQLHLALTDSFIKYALTALPEIPAEERADARRRAQDAYYQVNLAAAREFRRRRVSGAYSEEELEFDDALPFHDVD